MMTTTDQLIDLGDLSIAHRRVGEGPDLLAIHGWPLTGATWRNHLDVLSEHFTCHVIDLPGAGASVPGDGPAPALKDFAGIVERVISHLGLEKFALMGHDSGGFVARMVAARRSDQLTGLVLIETEIPQHRSRLLALYKLVSQLPGRVAVTSLLLSAGPLRRSPLVLGGCFSDSSMADGEFFDVMVRPLLADRQSVARQLDLLATWDFADIDRLAEIHPRITAPTLLIWGADDTLYFPHEKALAMTAQFGGPTRFELLGDAKLFLHEEYADTVAKMVVEFMSSSSSGG